MTSPSRRRFLRWLPAAAAWPARAEHPGVHFDSLLPPGPGNPRNTEGDFLALRDGRLLFAYTKFTGGTGDHDSASIVTRTSRDSGLTWSREDELLLANEGEMNVMSVSFLRARDNRILFFYLRKNSVTDCRVFLRVSSDEGRSWSGAVECIADPGYYVLNNDRAVQLRNGRLVLPVALHTQNGEWSGRGRVMFYLSDDGGRTWRRNRQMLECPVADHAGLQEPGAVELKDGRLFVFCRTALGSQYVAWSRDGAETWTGPEPSALLSPLSPASIERIPKTADLLAVWNDHRDAPEEARKRSLRTPLTVAISRDEGRTWINRKNLLTDPDGWYCYTAIEFVGGQVLMAYNAGGAGLPRLSRTQIARFPVELLYLRAASTPG